MLTLTGAGGAAHPHVASWYDILGFSPWWAVALWVTVSVFATGFFVVRRSDGDKRREAPWLAESLLYIFARAKDIESMMGDFEELFARDCDSGMSNRRAIARYWARVLRSIRPQLLQALKRIGWAGLIAAVLRKSGG
jgi:hypothetical protein